MLVAPEGVDEDRQLSVPPHVHAGPRRLCNKASRAGNVYKAQHVEDRISCLLSEARLSRQKLMLMLCSQVYLYE